MQVTAKVIEVLPMVSGVRKTDNVPWYKSTLIVETVEQYPRKIALANIKRAHEFSQLPVGSIYNFDINLESRCHAGKWYTEATCWNWNKT